MLLNYEIHGEHGEQDTGMGSPFLFLRIIVETEAELYEFKIKK